MEDQALDDLVALIRHLEVERVHLVGAKSGGSMTLKVAADHPDVVHTLTGVTPPVVGPAGARAWHFNWDAVKKSWVDDRDGHELYVRIGEVVSQKIGRKVTV